MPTVDELGIQINANARGAYNAIKKLSDNLEALSGVINKLDVGKLTVLSNDVNNLGVAMNNFATIRRDVFTKLADSLNRVSKIPSAELSNAATAINQITTSVSGLGAVTGNAGKVAELAQSISKLGGKGVQNAVVNIPILGKKLSELMATLSQAPAVSQNVMDFVNSISNLASQGRSIGPATRAIVSNFNSTHSALRKTAKHSKSLAATFGKLYASYFLLIRGTKAFYSAIQSTADYIEAFNYYDVTFGKIAKEWSKDFSKYGYENADSYAESFTKRLNETLGKMSGLKLNEAGDRIVESGLNNLGMNLTEITQYAAGIASITNAIGTTGEVSLRTSKAVTMLAADLGSLKNLDFQTVSANIQSALTGQARALYKYGIDVTNATLETYAATYQIKKSVSEMTQSEKMQLRLLAILDQSKVAWGDLANTINSPSNMIRQFSNNLKECGTVLGQLFIPTLERVLPVVNGVTIAIKRLLVNIAELLGIQLDLDSFGQGYTDGIEDTTDAIDGLSEASERAKKGVRAFDELNVISSGNNKVGELTDTLDLTEEIIKATSEYEDIWNQAYDKMINKAQEFSLRVSDALEPVRQVFADLSIGDYVAVGEDVSQLVTNLEAYISKAIRKVNWGKLGRNIGDFLKGIDWKEVFSGIADIIMAALSGAVDAWGGAFDAAPIETAILTAIGLLKFTSLGTVLGDAISRQVKTTGFAQTLASRSSLASLKLDAIALTAGVALQLENVSAITKGYYDAVSVKSGIKTALGLALSNYGGAKLISWLTGGATSEALLITLPISVALSISSLVEGSLKAHDTDLVENSIFSGINSQLDEIDSKTTDIASKWESIKDNLSMNMGGFDADAIRLKDMATKYYDLSQDYDNLTDEEKGLLEYYATTLADTVPTITEYINKVTHAYTGTKDELNAIISLELARLKQQGYKDAIVEAYAVQAQIQQESQKARKLFNDAYANLDEYSEKLDKAIEASYLQYAKQTGENVVHNRNGSKTLEEYSKYVKSFVNNPRGMGDISGEARDALVLYSEAIKALDKANTEVERINLEMYDSQSSIEAWSKELGEIFSEINSYTDQSGDAGSKSGGAYVDGYISVVEESKKDIDDAKRKAAMLSTSDLTTIQKGYHSATTSLMGGISKDIKGEHKTIADATIETMKMNTSDQNTINSNGEAVGSNYGDSVAKGILSSKSSIEMAFKSLSQIAGGVTTATPNFNIPIANISGNTSKGSANGIVNDLATKINSNTQSAGQQTVVFQVEGDPNGIFKVVQKESQKYANRTGITAFAY